MYRKNFKLNPRCYDPYQVTEQIRVVACKLKLLEGGAVYHVFHVLLLKQKVGDVAIVSQTLPIADAEGRIKVCPIAILDKKLMKKDNKVVVACLI